MTRHVAQVGEDSSTCRRKLKFNQAIRRDDHLLESIWTVFRGPVTAQVEVDTEEELLGYYGMEFCIVAAEPEQGLATMESGHMLRNEHPRADLHGDRFHLGLSWECGGRNGQHPNQTY